MTDTRSQQIAQLQHEIARIEAAISSLDGLPAAQAPLLLQLAAKQRQLAALMGQPSASAGTVNQYQFGGINFGVATNIGSMGDLVQGDKVGGDKVAGDKISVGNISDSSGIAIGRAASANVNFAQGPGGASAPELFEHIQRQIEALSEDPVIRADLAERVGQIEQQIRRGDAADITRIESQLKLVARLSPAVCATTLAALENLHAGNTAAVRQIAERVRAELSGS
jgi:hypothetical protein